jgi:hypothetical protein
MMKVVFVRSFLTNAAAAVAGLNCCCNTANDLDPEAGLADVVDLDLEIRIQSDRLFLRTLDHTLINIEKLKNWITL